MGASPKMVHGSALGRLVSMTIAESSYILQFVGFYTEVLKNRPKSYK